MQEGDAIHFTIPAVACRDGSLDHPAMLVQRSSTAGSIQQSGIPLMVYLLREFFPALIPGKDAELLQPTVINTRTSRTLTLPMPKGRGFLVRRPMRRLRGIGVLHDLPKREFPCAPRYVLFPFTQLWTCLPKPCAGCSLRHSHPCRDAFCMLGNPIRGRSNPLSVGSDSRRRNKSDLTDRRYRL